VRPRQDRCEHVYYRPSDEAAVDSPVFEARRTMRLQSRIVIHRTPEQVGRFLGDLSNVSKWDRGVSQATSPSTNAMAVGAEFTTLGHAGTRDGAGTQGRMTYRVAEVGPHYSIVELTSATGNARFFTRASWRFDLDQIPEGTLVTCTANFAVRLRYFLLAPILFVMRRAIAGTSSN
jgi:hypothetical protein